MTEQPDTKLLIEANKLAGDVTRFLMQPIINWYLNKDTSPGVEIVAIAHLTAILGCICILEEMFGEEYLRPYIDRAKEEVRTFTSATTH
jgi:hypothetical protein